MPSSRIMRCSLEILHFPISRRYPPLRILVAPLTLSKILDLKGTPRTGQNSLLDVFLNMTSTKEGLETTSFLSLLDMNPDSKAAATSMRPLGSSTTGGSRVNLPSLLTGSMPVGENGAPGLGISTAGGDRKGDMRREVFPDFRRFMTFGARKDAV